MHLCVRRLPSQAAPHGAREDPARTRARAKSFTRLSPALRANQPTAYSRGGSRRPMVSARTRKAHRRDLEETMYEHLMETYRKTSESWMQMQQDMWKSVMQQFPGTPGANGAGAGGAGFGTEASRGAQKRWLELAIEM